MKKKLVWRPLLLSFLSFYNGQGTFLSSSSYNVVHFISSKTIRLYCHVCVCTQRGERKIEDKEREEEEKGETLEHGFVPPPPFPLLRLPLLLHFVHFVWSRQQERGKKAARIRARTVLVPLAAVARGSRRKGGDIYDGLSLTWKKKKKKKAKRRAVRQKEDKKCETQMKKASFPTRNTRPW